MPFPTNTDLPLSIRHVLPEHAQDIYRAAFNHAWAEHGGEEVTAHRIAWAAVSVVATRLEIDWVRKQ